MLKEEYSEAANIAHVNAIEKLSLNHDNTTANSISSSTTTTTPTTTTPTAAATETVFFAPTITAASVEVIGTLSVSSVTHSGSNADSEATGINHEYDSY